MAGAIKHRHQTTLPATGADVDAGEWNDSLVMSGGSNGQVAMRDATQADGWKLANISTTATWATRAAADGKQGLFLPSDGYSMGRDNGSGWDTFGPIYPFVPPVDSGFSWDNQGTSTLSATADAIILTGSAAGATENIVARYHSAPATPWTLTCFIDWLGFNKGQAVGIFFREAATGKIVTNELYLQNSSFTVVRQSKYTNSTTKSADYQTVLCSAAVSWFRIKDDGANRISYVSVDGQNWVQMHSVTRTDFFTAQADQYGFHVNTFNSATPNLPVIATVLSLKVS